MGAPRVVLGVSGSTAAYKACDVIGLLRDRVTVSVVMTHAATRFVTPLLFEALTGQPVVVTIFGAWRADRHVHVALGRAADLLLVAPATAHTISRLAAGLASDALTSVALCVDPRERPCLIAPAMSARMSHHPAVTPNLRRLETLGYRLVSSRIGPQPCGDHGAGNLASPRAIALAVVDALGLPGPFHGS